MCGIVGIIDPKRSAAELRPIVKRMAATIVHRGPDDEGFFVRDGAAIGMRRLSIIDLAGGHQPISDESGNVQVVLNGEIYNFLQLRERLERAGHQFVTRSDTETIAHGYEEHGDSVPEILRGMFALAVWDEARQRLLLARDRLGKKPLYYAHSGGRLLFASEIKAILAADPELAERNDDAIAPYLRFGFVPQPATMFRRIRKLPAAHSLAFSRGAAVIEPYWNLDLAPDEGRSLASWSEELDAKLEEAVRLRLISDVPLGVFLSGGIDSSAVAAYMKKAGVSPLKTFTIGFDRKAWDESPDAEIVARHLGTEHHVLHLAENDLSSRLPETLIELVRHFDEPFGDSSALPTYHVSRLARQHVTVILSGDGGDEVFAGYSSHRGTRFAEQYRRLPRAITSALAGGARIASRISPLKRYELLRAARVLRDSVQPVAELYLRKTSLAPEAILRRIAPGMALPGVNGMPPDVVEVLRSDLPAVTRVLYADLRFRLLEDMLVKVDRMSMAHSLEVRSPFLDHELVEFAARMPIDLKLRGFETKAILRRVIRKYLPPQTMRKKKQGFGVPLREWLRNGLNEMAGDYLAGSRPSLPEEFDRAAVRDVLREHREGTADHSSLIWLLLNFATWHRIYIDEAAALSSAAGLAS